MAAERVSDTYEFQKKNQNVTFYLPARNFLWIAVSFFTLKSGWKVGFKRGSIDGQIHSILVI